MIAHVRAPRFASFVGLVGQRRGHFGIVGWVGIVALGGCAVAGSASPADATQKLDGNPRLIDAPSLPVDAVATSTCTSSATCATAIDLGGVSGDTGADSVMASGYQAAWYHVRVTENDSGVFGVPQMLHTQLTSPSTEQYDLFVYVNTGSDVVDCTTPTGSATTIGTTETLEETWGETGTFSNGNDDSRTVSIEIRPKAGTCAAAQPWHLVAQGDL